MLAAWMARVAGLQYVAQYFELVVVLLRFLGGDDLDGYVALVPM